jgi:hypothetical protein
MTWGDKFNTTYPNITTKIEGMLFYSWAGKFIYVFKIPRYLKKQHQCRGFLYLQFSNFLKSRLCTIGKFCDMMKGCINTIPQGAVLDVT